MRFVFALLVILSHSYPILYGNEQLEPLRRFTRDQMTVGHLAVGFFFIVSGFLITQSYLRTPTLGVYLIRRIARIYPGFIACFFVCILGVAWLGSRGQVPAPGTPSLHDLILWPLTLYLPPVAKVFVNNPIPLALNSSVWTIKYEFICYIVTAVLGGIGLLRNRRLVTVLFICCVGLHILTLTGVLNFPLPFENGHTSLLIGDLQYYPRFLSYFLAGALFYLYRDVIPRTNVLLAISIACLLLCNVWGRMLDMALTVAGTYLIFYVAFHPAIRLHKFAHNRDLSYGTYLYAYPVQQLLVFYAPALFTPLSLFATASIITVGLAFASWHILEKPSMQAASWLLQRLNKGTRQTTPMPTTHNVRQKFDTNNAN